MRNPGSPPRAWGRPTGVQRLLSLTRFTPTCVGKTIWGACCWIGTKVHPHVRGEDDPPAPCVPMSCGSPPRAWGRPTPRRLPGRFPRFTPTCVGKTKLGFCDHPVCAVHPHVRGEDRQFCVGFGDSRGSPPRAWGRPKIFVVICSSSRFTPTCVGKTLRVLSCYHNCTVHPHVRGEDDDDIGVTTAQ